MKLEEAAKIIERDSERAKMRRVNWRFLDDRLHGEFKKLKNSGFDVALGNFMINRLSDYKALKSGTVLSQTKLSSSAYLNATYIYAGSRSLKICDINPETKQLYTLVEGNAQLWYAQLPNGFVTVNMAPFESDIAKVSENEIIIDIFNCPSN